jgi:hypothetical protein
VKLRTGWKQRGFNTPNIKGSAVAELFRRKIAGAHGPLLSGASKTCRVLLLGTICLTWSLSRRGGRGIVGEGNYYGRDR